jgi:two-component system sensor histidine kinase BaeS
MRTKLFLAFVVIILTALLSTIIFEFMIVKDFDNYVSGVREDQIHWITVSVEGGYKNGKWDSIKLSEPIHWAMMQGLDINIVDAQGTEVSPSHDYIHSLSPSMQQRMEELFHIHANTSQPYTDYPIYSEGRQIATLKARTFQKKTLAEKEAAFKDRVRYFLYFYLLIAGIGTILIGLFLSQYLSKPLRSLKKASEQVGERDFSVRISSVASDEVGDLSRTFDRMAESLQKEELLRNHLMSNIAHELRTPLTIMKTHVEAITDGIIKDSRKGLMSIGDEIEKLISLVKGIEDITAAEASFFSRGKAEEISLKAFLTGIMEDIIPSFIECGLTLQLLPENDLIVNVDTEKLERIIRNLLSNALKFTDKGGVTIDYGAANGKFMIVITDTGRGISGEDLPLIFNRFYRSADSGVEGLGLGLAIVKELVTVMGGNIEAGSRLGKGSVFKIVLPFAV